MPVITGVSRKFYQRLRETPKVKVGRVTEKEEKGEDKGAEEVQIQLCSTVGVADSAYFCRSKKETLLEVVVLMCMWKNVWYVWMCFWFGWLG